MEYTNIHTNKVPWALHQITLLIVLCRTQDIIE